MRGGHDMQKKIRLIDADDMITALIPLAYARPWRAAQRGLILPLLGPFHALPKKEYDPPREGEWRLMRGLDGCCVCTACGAPAAEMSHYCPACGAKMRDPLEEISIHAPSDGSDKR